MIKKRVYPPKSSYRVKKLGALLSNETEKIIRGEKDWKDFLRVASKFISYPFHTQVMLYSQKPDTTAVASFQLWNKLGLSVAPGTHGIEVLTKLDTDYPSITQLHPIENVREAVRGRKKAFNWIFPLEATEQLVERICPVGTVGEKPEERLWNWTISNVETENAEEVFNKCEEKGYSLGVNQELLQNSELTQTEWLMKFMQASAAYEVFARCGLDTSICDRLNEALLQGNPFSLSALFESNEEAFGFLGDEISLTAGSAFKVIRTEVKAYTEEQAKIRADIIGKSVPLEREVAKAAAPMLEVSVSSNATDTKDNEEVVARYLSTMNMEDGYVNHIAILRGADGYHNHFLFDADKGKGAAGTGAFATLEEAKQDVLAHYPDATEIAPEISKEAEELAVAKKLITDFCEEEYGDEKVDFSDLHQVSLAYTTSEDEVHEIQVNCDLIDYRMDYLVDGVKVHEDRYNSLSDLISQELSGLDYDGLTSVALDTIPDQDKDIFFAAKDGNLYQLLDSWDEQYNKEEILSCQIGHSETDGEDFYLAVVKGGQLGKREFEFDQQPTREQVISRYADDEAEWAINRNEAAAEPFRELENEDKLQPDYDIKEITPLSDEYLDLKEAYPGYVIGVEVGPSYLFYGKDAKLTAELFGTKLITDHIPGIAETSVTGSSLGWQALANKLLEHGKSNLFARPENGSYVIQKINDIADFIPVGMQVQDGSRKFTIDSVNYESGSVSLRDDTFLQQAQFPIFRNEKISVVRELVEEEQARALSKAAELHDNEQMVLQFGEPTSSDTIRGSSVQIGFASTITDDEISDILRFGSNTSHAREHIADAFQKQKPDAEITALLRHEFHGGYGIRGTQGDYAAWYGEDGIYLHRGQSARYEKDAQVISWEGAANRIGQLLKDGKFATNAEFLGAESLVRTETARSVYYMYRDLSEEASKQGYLSCLDSLPRTFPDVENQLSERLSDKGFRSTLRDEYASFYNAYSQDKSLLRFHYHKVDEIWQKLKDLDRKSFVYDNGFSEMPKINAFITEDEINATISGNLPFSRGQERIYRYFTEEHSIEEKAAFLKNEYGTGGRSHAVSGFDGSSEDYDAKGIKLRKAGCADVLITWTKSADRITALINEGHYLTSKEEERPELQKTVPEEELDAYPTSAQVDGKWQTFSNAEELDKALHEVVLSVPAKNFRITDDNLGEGGPKEKFRRNMDAIRTLHTIEREGRQATHEEQEILSKYVGWGGLSDAFDSNKANWKSEYDELQTELTPEEYKSARGSVLNSHYTSPVLIRSIYAALSSFGFERGNVLEPACGVGNFFGMLPESMQNSRLFGVELDDVSGRIARQLYPNANISICGYENTKYPDNFFDVVVGNVPFGDYKVMDRAYDKYNFMIHDYFIAKGLDQLRPGGVMAVITSAGTMDKINASARQYFAGRANLLGAIRLPDNAFKANAGTEVMTDILFFQKADGNAEVNPDWLRSEKTIPDKEPLAVGDTVRSEVIRGYNRETRQYDPSKRTVTAVLTEIEKPYYGKGEYTYRGIDVETNEKVSFYEKPELVQRGVPVYTYNMYFQHHPEMVLGELKNESGPFGEKLTCKAVDDRISLEEKLSKAISNIKGVIPDISVEDAIEEEAAESQTLPADPTVKNFSYTVVDDKVYYRQNSLMILQKFSGDKEERMKALIGLSVSGYHLLKMELEDQADDMIQAQMAVLNEEYDDFVAKYGRIAAKENKLFENDASYGFVSAFENYDEKGKFIGKADIFSKRTVTPRVTVLEVDNAEDALLLSLSEKGKVDLPYMAGLMKDSCAEELPSQLKGIIYRDPEKAMLDPTSGYVTADEYLSGNIRKKIAAAEKASESDPSYVSNIEALKQVMPKPLEAQNIDVRLGATWIAPKYIQKFMEEKLNVPHYRMLQRGADEYVSFEPSTAEWYIANKSVGKSLSLCIATYGTERKNALEILENTLNLRDTKVYDRIIDEEGREKSVLNKTETALCNTKAELLKEEFENWIFSDPERRADLVKTYNERFNNVKTRSFDGSFLTFPGMNPEIHLREHQKNAVARALFGGNELLAHVVGAGKTYTMIASAMEAKRIGTAHKSLFVVPNHLTEQWGADFLKLYPTANVLVATKNDFTPARRKLFCSKIATGSYDAVIIGHSQFEKIPLSKQRQVFYMERQIDQITQALSAAKEKDGKSFTVKQLEKTQKKLKVKLDKLNDDSKKDDVVTFEQLGVDRLFVDESHYYKNLFLYTKMSNVAGVQQTEASKSSDMYMKCQYMDELTGGRGIVFATGTPISNSMTELYTNMRYLQAGVLREYGLDQFDAWAANFGNVVTAIELTPEGVGYRAKKRFSSFFNIPELMSLWHEAADVQTADMLKLPVPEAHIFNVKTKPTKLQKDMVVALADRAENVRNQSVDPSDDNMLKITNDGRKLALDQRMINPSMPDVPNSKVNSCVDISFGIWERRKKERSTQLIFCDLSTPKGDGSFNVYDDIKQKLINKGVPENEIAFIHDAKTEIQKDQLFKKVRNGEVRFLLGSTQKMGAGTNVQDHLTALHHLDVPWRPSDIEQREGRIIRQGNLNKDVSIYRYVTADTFDAYSWQLIENKQKFISQIMTSKSPVRTCSDIDESALSYAEVKALATGNPYIKEKMELDVSVAKLKMERSAYQSDLYRLQDESNIRLPKRIASLESAVKGMQADISLYDKMKPGNDDEFAMEIGGKTYTERKSAGETLNKLVRTSLSMYGQELPIGSYLGFKLLARMEKVLGTSVYVLNIKGAISHEVDLSSNDSSNLGLITKALNSMPKRLEELNNDLASANMALSSAKAAIEKPYAKEEIYQTQMARLKELDAILNISENADSGLAVAASDGEETAIVDRIVPDTDDGWKAFAEYDPEEVSLYKDESLDAPEITEALKIEETVPNDTEATDESEEEEVESTNVQSEVTEPIKPLHTEGDEGKNEVREEPLQQSENPIPTADHLEGVSSNQHQYKVRFSTMGNGITVWDENAPIEKKPYDTRHQVIDYHSLAYISPDGTRITYFVDEQMLPKEITDEIKKRAELQTESYNPEHVKYSFTEKKDVLVYDYSRENAAFVLQEGKFPPNYVIEEEVLLRYRGQNMDAGDLYSSGVSKYPDAVSAMLSLSDMPVEGEKTRIQVIGLDAEGKEVPFAYRISEEQLEELARHQVVKEYGIQDTLKEPLVRIEWSESELFKDGQIIPLSKAEALFAGYDQAQNRIRDMISAESNLSFGYYKKTKFQILMDNEGKLDHYDGRYDLGDGDGGLLNHIYSIQKEYIQNDSFFAANVEAYGKEEAEKWREEKADFLKNTLPTLQAYLRYEVVYAGFENWRIYDRFHHNRAEQSFGKLVFEPNGKEPMSFRSLAEARKYLETTLRQPEFMAERHHAIENRAIAAAQKDYVKTTLDNVEKCFAPLSDEDKDVLKRVRTEFSLELPSATKEKSCTYFRDGEVAGVNMSVTEAFNQMIVDRAIQNGKDFQVDITTDDGKSVILGKADAKEVMVPVDEVNAELNLQDGTVSKDLWDAVQGMVPVVKVEDPYNCLNLSFEEYQKHELDNSWKAPAIRYAHYGITLTPYQKEKLEQLNRQVGFYTSAEDIKHIASEKPIKGCNRSFDKKDIELASELKTEIVNRYDGVQQERSEKQEIVSLWDRQDNGLEV